MTSSAIFGCHNPATRPKLPRALLLLRNLSVSIRVHPWPKPPAGRPPIHHRQADSSVITGSAIFGCHNPATR
jgi:hypothetical protein